MSFMCLPQESLLYSNSSFHVFKLSSYCPHGMPDCQGLLKVEKWAKVHLGLPPSMEPLARGLGCFSTLALPFCVLVQTFKLPATQVLRCWAPSRVLPAMSLGWMRKPLRRRDAFAPHALPTVIPFSCTFSSSSEAFRCQTPHLLYE